MSSSTSDRRPQLTALDVRHLETFLALIEARGKFSAAASHLRMSQPGISHHINELERRLQTKLFDRARGRAARLTRAGRTLERHAREIVQMQRALFEELDEMRQHLGGQLRVGASPGPGEQWLPPLLCEFRLHHEQLGLELHVADARSIVDSVFSDEFELGFVGGKWSLPGLEFLPVHRDALVIVAAAGSPLAARRSLTLKDLAGAGLIVQEPRSGLRATFEQELAERDLTLQHFDVLAELGSQESVKAAVASGHGIGCVWSGSIAAERKLGSLVALDIQDFAPDDSFYAVRREHRSLSRAAAAFLSFVRQAEAAVREAS